MRPVCNNNLVTKMGNSCGQYIAILMDLSNQVILSIRS